MLYTVMPMEQVLNGYDKEPKFMEMEWQGRTLLVEQLDLTTVRIERLLQGRGLQDFLLPCFAPGTVLSLR
ncbi:YlzJ-like family protein [Paenibacillus profundus]|uniref:YlzJ-like family protein n=1 Tax=Paenibacillus profundus TaxID=1173085 RepID=A0ABS8YB02_9BACL|nr:MULTISPECIES: YlzJ-like family protein [Paenibacillus]MCE5168117.1 YlzJ-like family protein [Paenibacillus profundus]MCM3337365.1 YlzJ-like family protein [Paenibacillus sp. MER TA 81-3]